MNNQDSRQNENENEILLNEQLNKQSDYWRQQCIKAAVIDSIKRKSMEQQLVNIMRVTTVKLFSQDPKKFFNDFRSNQMCFKILKQFILKNPQLVNEMYQNDYNILVGIGKVFNQVVSYLKIGQYFDKQNTRDKMRPNNLKINSEQNLIKLCHNCLTLKFQQKKLSSDMIEKQIRQIQGYMTPQNQSQLSKQSKQLKQPKQPKQLKSVWQIFVQWISNTKIVQLIKNNKIKILIGGVLFVWLGYRYIQYKGIKYLKHDFN